MFLNKLLKQTGFSLPEIMVAMGLMGGVSLVTMKLMEDQASNESYIKANSEVAKTVSIIQSALNNPDTCFKMLSGKVRGGALADLSFAVNGGNKVLLAPGVYQGYIINAGDIQLANSPLGPNISDVVINFRIKNLNTKGIATASNKVITKRFSVVSQVNGGNVVQACGPVLSDVNVTAQQKICEDMSRDPVTQAIRIDGPTYWDPVLKICSIRQFKCPFGQLPFSMSSLGKVICVPAEQKLNPANLFDFNPVNCVGKPKFNVIQNGAMLKINCTP